MSSSISSRVLVVALNRWATHEDDGMIQHPVEATDDLELRGVLYALYATVVHLGDSPKSGGYITIARHRTSDAAWWVYNDRVRVIATEEQRRTTCFYEGQQMKSYALLYEKHTPKSHCYRRPTAHHMPLRGSADEELRFVV